MPIHDIEKRLASAELFAGLPLMQPVLAEAAA
jgi:hypothetical protein